MYAFYCAANAVNTLHLKGYALQGALSADDFTVGGDGEVGVKLINFKNCSRSKDVRADDEEDKDEAMTASDSDYLSRFVAPEVTNSSK